MTPNPGQFFTQSLERLDSGWQQKTLPNGLTIIHIPGFGADHFYLGAMIKTGTRMESEANNGISHFLEHMMFRGSQKYPSFFDLAAAFEKLGGEWNAETGHEHTEYWYTGIRHNARDVIDLFADFMFQPALLDIETERKVIIREIEGDLNEFGNITDTNLHISELMWPQCSLALPITGTPETVAKINLDQLRAYREAMYTPSQMAICAVGGDAADIMPHLEQAFSGAASSHLKPSFPALASFTGPAVRWVEDSDNEYSVHLAFLCGGEWHEDLPIYELIVRILADGFTSRLNARLREQLGLVYDIDAGSSHHSETGSIDIYASVLASNIDVFLKECFLVLDTFLTDGPTEEELARVKTRAIVDLELSPEDPEDFGSSLCWAFLCQKPYSLVAMREKIMSIDTATLMNVARQIMRKKNAALVAIGPGSKDLEKRMMRAIEDGLPG